MIKFNFKSIVIGGLMGLFVGVLFLSFYTGFCLEKAEQRITKLEESMVNVQKNIITHDEIIFKNWTLLYTAINMPQEELDKLDKLIKIREAIWVINH